MVLGNYCESLQFLLIYHVLRSPLISNHYSLVSVNRVNDNFLHINLWSYNCSRNNKKAEKGKLYRLNLWQREKRLMFAPRNRCLFSFSQRG